MTVRRRLLIPLPVLLLSGYFIPFDRSVDEVAHLAPITSAAEDEYRSLPELPTGASERRLGGVEESALELAKVLRAVPVAQGGAPCPADRLQVVWEKPGGAYRHGAVVEPLGPAPDAATEAVNGAVVCEGAGYAYMGFEARWAASAWDVVAVPFIDETEEHVHEEPAPAPAPPSAAVLPSLDRAVSAAIEGYARYEPQRTCDPTPKPGTVSLQRMLLNENPGSRNLGISRGCSIGGQSEHKEGRAFDWGVNVHNPRERAQADGFVARLLATDSEGNRHAVARRMGVMYIIWNRQIWSSYRPSAGWRPYSGASPHTDHVHISLSWGGALGRTSFWSGTVPAELLLAAPATVPATSHRPAGGASPATGAVADESRRWRREHDHGDHGGAHAPEALQERAERRQAAALERAARHEAHEEKAQGRAAREEERNRRRPHRESEAPPAAPAPESAPVAPAAAAPAATASPAPAPAPAEADGGGKAPGGGRGQGAGKGPGGGRGGKP